MNGRFALVAAAALLDRGRVLLVRQTYGPRKWTLPGGHVEPHETLSEAVRREVREEVGLVVTVQGLLGVRHRAPEQPGDANDAYFVFVVAAEQPTALRLDQREIAASRFFAADEVQGLPAEEIFGFVRWIALSALAHRGWALPDLGNPTRLRGFEMYFPRAPLGPT